MISRAQFESEADARLFLAGVELADNPDCKVEGLYRKNGKYYVQIESKTMQGTIRLNTLMWAVKKG
jgi:hypothetical protein